MNQPYAGSALLGSAGAPPAGVALRILMVADGRIGFDSRPYFSLGILIEHLEKAGCAVTTAYRATEALARARGVTQERPDWRAPQHYAFTFEPDLIERYDQLWLFGDSPFLRRGIDDGFLTTRELEIITRFMNAGGGVFATGDHEDLGLHLSGLIPRVRSMRKWWYHERTSGVPRPRWALKAPSETGADRHDTVLPGTRVGGDPPGLPRWMFEDESDDRAQTIVPKLYHPLTWCAARDRRARPHPLLSVGTEVMDVLSDHPHEGDCIEPADLTRSYDFNGYAGREFPLRGEVPSGPEVIAFAFDTGHRTSRFRNHTTFKERSTGKRFGAIGVYDGHRAGVGRVVVDSTWHHFMNWNLVGSGADPQDRQHPCEAQRRGFLFSERGIAAYRKIQGYFRNIACWLAPEARQASMRRRALWALKDGYPGAEFPGDRPLPDLRFAELSYMGSSALGELVQRHGSVQARRWLGELLAPVDAACAAWVCGTAGDGSEAPFGGALSEQVIDRLMAVLAIAAAQSLWDVFGTRATYPGDDDVDAALRTGARAGLDAFASWIEQQHSDLVLLTDNLTATRR